MKSLKVGIASYGDMKARTMAIARGELKSRPGEPEVWFTSIESFAKVLSDRNRALLRLIMEEEPQSLTALAEISGRAKSNLSRTLHTLERYHLVHLESRKGRLLPRVSEIPSFCYVNRIRRQSWRDRTSGILKVGRIAHLN